MSRNSISKQFYARLLNQFRTCLGPVYVNGTVSRAYPELYARMCQINEALAGRVNQRIAVYCPKSFDAYAAIFATFLSRNVWVPLSENVPDHRNRAILDAVRPDVILLADEAPIFVSQYAAENTVETVSMRAIDLTGPMLDFSEQDFQDDDLAYILFTSGSTGIPKGVPMTNLNFINFIHNCFDILPFGDNEVFSDFHDVTFDLSIFYLFCCPLTGGAFAPALSYFDTCFPLRFMQENRVTIWASVPSSIRQIMAVCPQGPIDTDVRIMFLCGEPLSLSVLEYSFEHMHIEHVYNFYGLTETGVENFYHTCHPSDVETYGGYGFAPIGKPLPGNDIEISEKSELILGGCQIARSYLDGRDPHRFLVKDGQTWFCTGDIVEECNGVYMHKGRLDLQVKLNGHRIHLLDIESSIKQTPRIFWKYHAH